MDLRQLTIFMSVANHGSFTEAARALFISQPTISVQIASLERELGVAIVQRQSRGVALTPAGQILKRYAADMLMLRDQAISAVDQYRCEICGNVKVTASTVPADYVLPRLVSLFLQIHPKVMIALSRAPSQEVWKRVLNYEAELGVVGTLGPDSDIDHTAIMEDEIVLIAQATGKYSDWDPTMSLDRIIAEPMVCRGAGSGTQKTFEDALRRANVDPETLNIRARLESPEAIRETVARGTGLAVMSQLAVARDVASGSLREIRIRGLDLRRSFYMITHRKKVLSPAVDEFRRFTIGQLGGSQDEPNHSLLG
ncbi:MAG: selenium metabolism-associated LysR family transcriptional regulator [Clostridia bacterium]|nr:selenium metabolism-associated LysR family transcriptional regulator [Clostridia bacterium]